jgi:hypothetical protein
LKETKPKTQDATIFNTFHFQSIDMVAINKIYIMKKEEEEQQQKHFESNENLFH